VLTNGGRVLAVTSFGNDYKEALSRSYDRLKGISFKDIYYREDLGFDLD
jgi:phosphoribosylamine--glycine ligase